MCAAIARQLCREVEKGKSEQQPPRIEIWTDGGEKLFILNPLDHTYYEAHADPTRIAGPRVSLAPLTVRSPFREVGAEKIKIDMRQSPRTEQVSGYECQTTVLTFSYGLKLRVEHVPGTIPAHVEGAADFCVMDSTFGVVLPFDHALMVTSGVKEVDAAISERLSALKGIPLRDSRGISFPITAARPTHSKGRA